MIEAPIFDFDGLILDAECPGYQSWQEMYRAYGCSFRLSKWAEWIGSFHLTWQIYSFLLWPSYRWRSCFRKRRTRHKPKTIAWDRKRCGIIAGGTDEQSLGPDACLCPRSGRGSWWLRARTGGNAREQLPVVHSRRGGEPGESIVEAARRETLEEAHWLSSLGI